MARSDAAELERYLARVNEFLASLATTLSDDERSEVQHLIDHDEIGEALCTLAWIIVDGNKTLSAGSYATLMELSRGLVAPEDLPSSLSDHIRDDVGA